MTQANHLTLEVKSRSGLTGDIEAFTLSAPDGAGLPGFTPGAHIAVETPSGAMRRYSLLNDGTAPVEYMIAIKREADSRGGSVSMHDKAQAGTRLMVEPPGNDFELVAAPKYLLIAGGIGITPILAMARQLSAQGKPFRLIYCTRSPEETAFLDECKSLPGAVVHHDRGEPDARYDFWDHFENPSQEHVYCCGPKPLMEEIKAVSGHWPENRIHFEDFKGVEAVRDDDHAFRVIMHATNREVEVPADKSILEALRDAGESVISSCESGTCGTCKCRLIAGEVDHRDLVLMDEEKSEHIMICVSRAKTDSITIDF